MDQIFKFVFSENLAPGLYFIALFLAVFTGFFLYWRGGRHELYESNFLLDLALICTVGGLIFGRLLAYVFNFEYFNFSLFKLIFFHIFPGFSFWGFLIGVLIFGFLYLRRSKENFYNIFDLAAPALAFSGFCYYFFILLISDIGGKSVNPRYLFIAIFYFGLFFIFKRLSTKKRHKGFFTGLYFLTIGTFYTFLNLADNWGKFDLKFARSEQLIMPILFTVFGGTIWYKFSKRTLNYDIKGFFAFMLLNLFKFRRAVMSSDEAGRIAKSVLFLPYFIFKSFLVLLRMFLKEVAAAFWEFLYILGLRKY